MSDRRLANETRRIYDKHQSIGKFDLDNVEDEVEQYVIQNPDVINQRKIVHNIVKTVDESTRLRPDRGQLDLWPEDDLKKTIPTGNERERIEWGKAKDAEIDGWEREETANFLKIVTSFETARFLREKVRKEKKPNETVAQFYARKRKELKKNAAAKTPQTVI